MGLRVGEVKIQYRAFGSRQLFVAARNQLSTLNFHLQGAPEKFGWRCLFQFRAWLSGEIGDLN
jgi:hypothetical protein